MSEDEAFLNGLSHGVDVERLRLVATAGELDLLHGLVAATGQPQQHRPHQFTQTERSRGEREEVRRIAIHRSRSDHRHTVDIGGEGSQR